MSNWERVESIAKNDKGEFVALIGGKWEPVAQGAKNDKGEFIALRTRAPIKDNLTAESLDPSSGMSGIEKFNAGVVKAITDTGRGLGQWVGLVNRKDVEESRNRDRALMESGAATAGNIAGHVGLALAPGAVLKVASLIPQLARVAPALSAAGGAMMAPASIPAALAVGGVQGAIQPSASTGETIANTVFGAGASALFPAIGKVLETGKAAAEPLYKSGQDKILRKLVDKVSGGEGRQVAQRIDDAFTPAVGPFLPGEAKTVVGELVPGSVPTLGQVAKNPGVGALERTLAATNPEVGKSIGDRLAEQNVARVGVLESMAGTGGKKEMFEAARDATAEALYAKAMKKGINAKVAAAIRPEIESLMENPAIQDALPKARRLAKFDGIDLNDPQGSIKGLHYVKKAIDDMLDNAKQSGIGKIEKSKIVETKNDLLALMDKISPAYANARAEFQAMSRPVNQMAIAEELGKKSIAPLTGQLQPNAFARTLSDATAAKATGLKTATLEGTMDQRQLAALQAIKDDLARSVAAQNVGRGVGSDTVQKLAYANMIDAAGVPSFIRNNPGMQVVGNLASRAGDAIYGRANREMSQRLAELMADPRSLAAILNSAPTTEPLLLQNLLRGGASLGMMAPGMVNAQK